MSTNRLGRAENLDRFWFQGDPSTSGTQVDLSEPVSDTVSSLPEVDQYPYENQRRFKGEFEYGYSDWKDRTQTVQGNYEYRVESGLFILDLSSGRIHPEDVITALNDQLADVAEIDDSLSVDRKPLWSFFQEADQYDELTIAGPKGRFDFNTLQKAAKAFTPAELDQLEQLSEVEASKQFENAEELKGVVPLLREMDLTADVESPVDLGINPFEYLIENAVVGFEYGDELIHVEYHRGDLTIDRTASKEGEEFIIQLFEKTVVYPSYGR